MNLYGRNPVIERLRFNPLSVLKIYIQSGLKNTGFIRQRARKFGIPLYVVPKSKIQRIARNTNNQGIIVRVEDYQYAEYDDILLEPPSKRPTLIFLDGLIDPQNLGAILRSLACLGKFAIVLPKHNAVGVTESVLRVASGGDNFVQVVRISNLRKAISVAKEKGYEIVGTIVQGGESLFEKNFSFPLGVVIGSEQKGIRDIMRPLIDSFITIPMAAGTITFNVAQATTLIAYEITKQKKARQKK